MTLCSYCGPHTGARAIHADHIVSGQDRKRTRPDGSLVYEGFQTETTPACGPCNWFKLTRKLTPFGHPRLAELQAIDSTWREWDGDTKAKAFAEVHI